MTTPTTHPWHDTVPPHPDALLFRPIAAAHPAGLSPPAFATIRTPRSRASPRQSPSCFTNVFAYPPDGFAIRSLPRISIVSSAR